MNNETLRDNYVSKDQYETEMSSLQVSIISRNRLFHVTCEKFTEVLNL